MKNYNALIYKGIICNFLIKNMVHEYFFYIRKQICVSSVTSKSFIFLFTLDLNFTRGESIFVAVCPHVLT